jgi:dolichol-phosphate mannosyltransferase
MFGTKTMSQSGVSVVTTTWNERSTIENLIFKIRTVLLGIPHEIIVVDDESQDGTIDIARRLADVAVTKKREGQTVGLLYGMRLAKYPVVVTIDSDLENSPEGIPELVSKTDEYSIAVASRTKLPNLRKK